MAKVKITGHASGSGVFTITAPNSNTDRTITLPDASVTIGTDATKLPLAGGTMTGATAHGDNIKSTYGAAPDLEIFHDGTHSYIKDVGTGDLRLMGTNLSLRSESTNEPYLNATENGAVDLFHNNVKKFETTATGVTIAGTVASIISANNAQGEIAFGDPEDANIGRIAYNHPSNFLATVVNANEYMRIHSNGVTSIPSGVALGVGTANTASNVLDDYEEGVCQIRFKAAGNNTLAGSSSMKYTKIGRLVTVSGDMSGNISGLTQNANMELSGLPFTTSGVGTFAIFTRNFEATGSNTINTVGYFPSGGAYLQVWTMPNHGNYVLAKVQDFHASTNDLYFSVTYST